MAENKKYVFAQRDVDDFSCIKLTEGPFSDFRQYIGDILVEVIEEQLENGTIKFKW